MWRSIHKSLQWLPLCVNSKPHSSGPARGVSQPRLFASPQTSQHTCRFVLSRQPCSCDSDVLPLHPAENRASVLPPRSGTPYFLVGWDPSLSSLLQQTDLSCVALIVTQNCLLICCYMKAEVESSRIFLRLECLNTEVSAWWLLNKYCWVNWVWKAM